MSVVPVADALRRLADDGLVESRARAGTRVRVPSATDIRDLYELRQALETQTARLFSTRATPANRSELTARAEEVDAFFNRLFTESRNPAFRFKVHIRHVGLHMCIARHARNQLLMQMIERNHVLVLNWLLDVSARRTPLPRDFHAQLAAALVSGDASAADAAMRAHIQYGLAEISSNFAVIEDSSWREPRLAASSLKRKRA
jgi:GntR family transcriptional regulator, rspAB operon transcriptional repressor